jgi:ribosomal-protein-alanine N-acetyltransferase
VVGYAVTYIGADQCEIANVAVSADARGAGIGRQLLDRSLSMARDRGVRRAYLEVRASNHVAQSLYASFGFTPVAVRQRYYQHPTEDALVMRLDLDHVEATGESAGVRG